ncbi:MAG: lipid A-modifier LpxR family protein, partial [Bacteroidia bacterium]
FLISIDKQKKQRLSTSLDLGVIGPNGGGEQEQKAIHKALNNIQPLGWQFQIANDYVINYDLLYEKGLLVKKHLEIMGLAGFRAGTLYDDIGGGLLIRAGWMYSYFENLGLMKHSQPHKKFHCSLYARGEVRAVGYNATMQGGFFLRNSVYTIPDKDIERVLATTSAGIILSYKRVSIEYGKVYITPEFRNGLDHGWGHVVITTCF